MAKFSLGFGLLTLHSAVATTLFIKTANVITLISLFAFVGTHFITKGPAGGMNCTQGTTTSTEKPIPRSVIRDVFNFVIGYDSDHGVLVFSGVTAYIVAELSALLFCIHAIFNNRPRYLRPEMGLNVAYGCLQMTTAIILISAIATFGLEWLVQMMVNSKRVHGIDLSIDYVEEIRRRVPMVLTLFILFLILGGLVSFWFVGVLGSYERHLRAQIAAEGDLIDGQVGNGQPANAQPANRRRGRN